MATKKNALATKGTISIGFSKENFDLRENMAKEMDGLTPAFDHVKMPSGGITLFSVPTDDPENPDMIKEFSAVILYHHPMRAYYKEKYTGGNNPPDCGSFDGVTGQGNPGGLCCDCPYNDFGTGENGAKACKERRRLYLLREGDVFPILLSLPPGSLKDFGRYLMRCLSRGYGSNMVVTKFSLAATTSKNGIVYAKAQFRLERVLNEKEINAIMQMSEQIQDLSRKVNFDIAPAVNENKSLGTGAEQNLTHIGLSKLNKRNDLTCHDCGQPISDSVHQYTAAKYGRPLCENCQQTANSVA